MNTQSHIKKAMLAQRMLVKRPAQGRIKHDYLVPGGPYEEHWDWDGFFVGVSLASEISSEAIYLKNWSLNYLEHTRTDGFIPGLLTPAGTDKRLRHIKPFLAQGCYLSGRWLNDYQWVLPHWRALQKSVHYREQTYHDARTGLSCWHNSMESGADNNVAALDFPNGTVAGADLNTFLYREFLALALLAKALDKKGDYSRFADKAQLLKQNMLRHLWNSEDEIFYNLDIRTGKHIKRVSYAATVPLWAAIAPRAAGKAMVKRYMLNPHKLKSRYGIRTLAKDDPQYNNVNMIKPHSNWQGPVWPIANYLALHALLHYGFAREAKWLAQTITRLCLVDIKKTGGMHENYHADTGAPLAAPDFISWNLLVGQMMEQAQTGKNPLVL